MPSYATPDDFLKVGNSNDLKQFSINSIRNAQGRGVVPFRVAENFTFKNKKNREVTISKYFIVVDKKYKKKDDKKWEPIDGTASVSTGECRIVADPEDSSNTIVVIKSAKGRINQNDVIRIANEWLPSIFRTTAQDVDTHSRNVAQKSHNKTDQREITDAISKLTSTTCREIEGYTKFENDFKAFLSKWGLEAVASGTLRVGGETVTVSELPTAIWKNLMQGIVEGSGKIGGDLMDKSIKSGNRLVLAWETESGQRLRTLALQKAMDGLKLFQSNANSWLDKVAKAAKKNTKWCFWSGEGALTIAERMGISLESSVGSWFNAVSDFSRITGYSNFQLWTSLSELYAKKAAEYYNKFEFVGVVGPRASNQQTVFRQIEQPVFKENLKKLNNNKNVPINLNIEWYVAHCVEEENQWVAKPDVSVESGLPKGVARKCANREQAIAAVKELYGN